MSNAALSWARAQRGMTPCERLVLMILADCANGDNTCWPSQDALAEETGMPRPSISRTIKRLASLGKIEIGGHANRRTYRLAVTTCDDITVTTGDVDVAPSYVSVTSRQPDVTSGYTNPKEPKITQKEVKSGNGVAALPDPAATMTQIWNEECAGHGLLVAARSPRAARQAICRKRWKEDFTGDAAAWRDYCRRVAASPHLRGENDRGWHADLDWVLQSSNLTHIMEGRYGNGLANGGGGSQQRRRPSEPPPKLDIPEQGALPIDAQGDARQGLQHLH